MPEPMTTEQLIEFVDDAKTSLTRLQIPILDEEGLEVGILRPINKHDLENPKLVNALTDWRNANMEMFLTNFKATPERTLKYLEKIVSKHSNQTLFVIFEGSELVGQVGWKDLCDQSAIMDNGMKGARTKNPKILIYAHQTLANWLFENSQIDYILGWLFTDNIPGIMMNKKIGWDQWIKYPLIKKIVEGEVNWQIGEQGQESADKKHCFKLIMDRKR